MDNSIYLDALVNHINRYTTVGVEEKKLLNKHIRFVKVKNKEHLLKTGEICRANHFVVKGCVRMYSYTDKGTEQIIQFGIENWWITDYTSLESRLPSEFNIQSLEEGVIGVLDRQEQDELFNRLPGLERYFRQVLQRAFAATLMRVHFIFSESGEERYRHFNSCFPEFVQRIPQYMLASYLGFTPEFLSKIRAKFSVQ